MGEAAAAPVTVIGGGIVGLCCALQLQARFADVAIVDPGDLRRAASYGNAGQLALGEVVPLAGPDVLRSLPKWMADPLGPLAIRWEYFPRALPWFLRFIREGRMSRVEYISRQMAELCDLIKSDYQPLLAAAKADHLVVDQDYLRLYQSEEQWRSEGYRWALREKAGLQFDTWGGEKLRALAPYISPAFTFGVTMKGRSFFTSLPKLMLALQDLFRARGGTIINDEVVGFATADAAVSELLLKSRRRMPVRRAVIAAGAWSGRLTSQLGDKVPLESERGYHVMLPDAGVRVDRTLSYVARGLVITPMSEGLRLAGTVEFAGLEAPPNFARAEKLIEAAKIVLPQLNTANAEFWMGHRPSLPDALPIIDRSSRYPNVHYAFGHGHMGLSWAATTGRLLADLVTGVPTHHSLEPFRLGRF
jgi:D-amino-acid dehydrogenase